MRKIRALMIFYLWLSVVSVIAEVLITVSMFFFYVAQIGVLLSLSLLVNRWLMSLSKSAVVYVSPFLICDGNHSINHSC